MLVRGAGRGVDEEVRGRGPEDVGEELADHGGLFGPAPDDGGGAGGEEEGEGYGMQGSYRLFGSVRRRRRRGRCDGGGVRVLVCCFGRWGGGGVAGLRLGLNGWRGGDGRERL